MILIAKTDISMQVIPNWWRARKRTRGNQMLHVNNPSSAAILIDRACRLPLHLAQKQLAKLLGFEDP
jgi:hypothetical protein